ncbi:carbohydrate-binding domain-containing protein [Cryobacterium sp. PH29-G1]|uniref:carbohydrate-binding domain-containing protein n=1 Tax=Cryobacterium sp. PH29-G1 TaxID=3046211 RepID=UPI0024BB565A|nr:carbohydrate-binding domain-containing protein [Cryobacterium sp. PH29-G1]MDJ0349971.1 carbohydrate-binding domain-containing protein [Cryobacterium sp. PH29-G1]
MKNRKYTLAAATSTLIIGGLLLAGCSSPAADTATTTATTSSSISSFTTGAVATEVLAANANSTTVNDDEWTTDGAVTITLSGTTASADGDGVALTGSTVTISAAGTYVVTGQFDGQVVVDTDQEGVVALILYGAEISSSTSAAIAVLNAEDVAVSLSGTNVLTSTGDDDEANAALFSDADMTISGDGSLTVNSSLNDGITSQDDLMVLSGNISVTAGDDGLRGKDSLTIAGGSVTVDAGGDALKSDDETDDTRGFILISGGTLDLVAGDDGMQAQTDLVITGGETMLTATDDGLKSEVNLVVAGGTTAVESSYEGVESYYITIEGGALDVHASDDGINATSGTSTTTDVGGIEEADDGAWVTVSGGETTVEAEGDGIDSNGSALFTGGTVTVFGSSSDREGALDTNGSLVVDGGTVLAVGTTGMAVSPDASSAQGWFSAALDQTYGAGESVQVLDDSGALIMEFSSAKTFQSVVLSDASLVAGSTYTVTVGDQTAGTVVEGVAAAGGMGGGPARP